MRKITINGIEIECDDNVELSIEGNKVTVKAAPAKEEVHHHHHYSGLPTVSPYIGTPYFPPNWGQIIVNAGPDNPPMTGNRITVSPADPLPVLSCGAVSFHVH